MWGGRTSRGRRCTLPGPISRLPPAKARDAAMSRVSEKLDLQSARARVYVCAKEYRRHCIIECPMLEDSPFMYALGALGSAAVARWGVGPSSRAGAGPY